MNFITFDSVVRDALQRSSDILTEKGQEYSVGDDRLSQFKLAAGLNNVSVPEALWGMATKHISSAASMVKNPSMYNIKTWREKLDDIRNYTLLLEAVLIEQETSFNEADLGDRVEESR